MLPDGPYKSAETEASILDFWLKQGLYSPEYHPRFDKKISNTEDSRETFTIILPPPNANGNLHLGHMSGYAYQDIMGRYQRMQGKKVLLLPGKDHAGIQTEVVFEQELTKEGTSKKELGREEFYRRCYEFCMEKSANARRQEQSIGLSADFDRELFTLDPRIVDEVLKAFIQMHDDKLVYRGKRIINWCPRCQSALADIDTEFKDSIGEFVYFKYALPEPTNTALAIRDQFSQKIIDWKFERVKTKDGEADLPFSYGHYQDEKWQDLEIIGIGYSSDLTTGSTITGAAIGVQLRLDQKYRLVVVSSEFTGDLDKELARIFKFEIQYYAGGHIVRFDRATSDNDYCDGFVIGTVRPETVFGDTAIAVNPEDKRYSEYIGTNMQLTGVQGPTNLNIIADKAVVTDFGTGALKITPAHATEDWDIAMRHTAECMPEKQCIDFDGKLNHLCGEFAGMTVKQGRAAITEKLEKSGLLILRETNYENRLRICERCKHPIEPLVSHQWFVDTRPLKAKARELVESGVTDILPEGKKNVYINWMNTEEDWCITRQLWWGYRIPVWYKGAKEQFVDGQGIVREKIGTTEIKGDDYGDLMRVQTNPPHSAELLVVRHGETEYNRVSRFAGITDPELNQTGRDQAEKLAKSIAGEKYDLIISSELLRAKETAQALAEVTGLEVITDSRLNERNFGDIEGLTVVEVTAKFPQINPDSAEIMEEVPNGESRTQLEARVNNFLQDLEKNYRGKRIIVVTHSGVIRLLLNRLTQTSPTTEVKKKFANAEAGTMYLPDSEWQQDPDVLDTWFSSGQWPYVTLQANSGDFATFYPTQVMETGWDILIFWVTRMMLLNPYRAAKEGITAEFQQTPFHNVFLHGLVLDKNGAKMSKSKGNGIDPFEMMQKYGTDALRLSFVIGNSAGQNYRLYEEKIAANARFANKLWNASKFVMLNLSDYKPDGNTLSVNPKQESNQRLSEHLQKVKDEVTHLIDTFQFGIAAQVLHQEFWHEFCDIHLEAAKQYLQVKKNKETGEIVSEPNAEDKLETQALLYSAMREYLKMIHPFMPFITEAIWQELPKLDGDHRALMYNIWK